MKNKQKAWRRDAHKVNLEKGSKHNGRSMRHTYYNIKPSPYHLLGWLLDNARDQNFELAE